MTVYPVHYSVERPLTFTRLQLVARLVAFCALGLFGLSFGVFFLFAYLALPVFAASRLSTQRTATQYLDQDGPRVLTALRWFAAVSGWAGLITDRLPSAAPDEIVRVTVAPSAAPSAASAMWRVVTGLPSALVLAVLGWIGTLVWLWAALSVLLFARVGLGAFEYLVGLQRWSIRLLVFQASLVDEYPPFSFSDPPPASLPEARADRG
jgi:hypothetical protein